LAPPEHCSFNLAQEAADGGGWLKTSDPFVQPHMSARHASDARIAILEICQFPRGDLAVQVVRLCATAKPRGAS
jgi:hypothetical protein